LDSGCACSVYVMAPKGRKKAKGTTVDLAEFLAKTGQAPQNTVATTIQVRGTGSWADEVDDDDVGQTKQIFLPTAPRAAMEFNDDHVPYSPPFTARIANLSYDTDEEQVKECFERARLKVQTVRLMKDAEAGGRLKGYGYIDFFERESLVDALQMQEISMNNRKVRIDLATGAGKDRGGGGFGDRDRRGGFGDRGGERGGDRDPDAGRSDAGDWRSAPAPPMKEDNRSRGGFDRYDSDRGGDRGFGGFRDRGDRDGDRRGGGGGGFDNYRRRSPEPVKERPRIVLQPRSAKKEEEEEPAAPKPVEKSSEQPRGSIFGSAKPVDTTAKHLAQSSVYGGLLDSGGMEESQEDCSENIQTSTQKVVEHQQVCGYCTMAMSSKLINIHMNICHKKSFEISAEKYHELRVMHKAAWEKWAFDAGAGVPDVENQRPISPVGRVDTGKIQGRVRGRPPGSKNKNPKKVGGAKPAPERKSKTVCKNLIHDKAAVLEI